MIGKSVTCVVAGVNPAEQLLERLRIAGFSKNYISVLFLALPGNRDNRTNTVFDWLGALRPLPAVQNGNLIVGGAILAASSGNLKSADPEILLASLKSLGILQPQAGDYLTAVNGGATLISVIVTDADGVSRARWIFEDSHAQNITVSRESRLLEPEDPAAKMDLRPKRERHKRFGRLFTG